MSFLNHNYQIDSLSISDKDLKELLILLNIDDAHSIIYRMHRLNRSISFFSDLKRLIESGFPFDSPNGRQYLEDMDEKLGYAAEQIDIINRFLLLLHKRVLKFSKGENNFTSSCKDNKEKFHFI